MGSETDGAAIRGAWLTELRSGCLGIIEKRKQHRDLGCYRVGRADAGRLKGAAFCDGIPGSGRKEAAPSRLRALQLQDKRQVRGMPGP